ncbi:MAG: hypothetical protein IKZ88_09875 [Neisseriaceae bacterium]|nr:hypothetical protein [Neisseriaceae bacterium]
MSKAIFKIGDTVRIIDGSKIHGYVGGFNEAMGGFVGEIRKIKIVTDRQGKPCYYLENSPFLWDERGLKRVKEEKKIVITVKDRTTRAAMYDGHKLIKETTVKCHEDDVLDFMTGAILAFNKLKGANTGTEEKPTLKLLNTKIFVLDGANNLKTAHIYNIVDGKILINNCKFPINGNLYNMDDVVNYLTPVSSRTNDKDSAGRTLSEFTSRKITVIEVKEN